MKTNANKTRSLHPMAHFAIALLFAAFSLKGSESNTDETARIIQNLVVQVDDLEGRASMDSEWARESLLEKAFYDAAKRHPWLQKPKFRYNNQTSEETKASLSIQILRWKRSLGGTYEFSANAKYLDADGQTHDLGLVSGSDIGIMVNTGHDAGEAFARAAQEGFEHLLRRIKKISNKAETLEAS